MRAAASIPDRKRDMAFVCAVMIQWNMFHGGGPRVERKVIRPITDVVVTEKLTGSLT